MDNERQRIEQWMREFNKLGEHSKSPAERFRDFIELSFCTYAKLTALSFEEADKLEARYMRVANSYQDKDVIRAYPEFLAEAIQNIQCCVDFFGQIAAEYNVLDARRGQFFTPMSLCKMLAKIQCSDLKVIEEKGYVEVYEPAAGSGAIILAFADELYYSGYDPAIHMMAHCTELNQLSYEMCFIQLAVAGIPAAVIHGNTLSMEMFESRWTPAAVNAFYRHHEKLPFGGTSDG